MFPMLCRISGPDGSRKMDATVRYRQVSFQVVAAPTGPQVRYPVISDGTEGDATVPRDSILIISD